MKHSTLSLLALALLAMPLSLRAGSTGPAVTPNWIKTPGSPKYYINSVSISGDASRVVAGTFYHTYSDNDDDDATLGLFGTYCYSRSGDLLWKNEFRASEGVYWVDISTNGLWAASGGWISPKAHVGFVRAYDATTGNAALNYQTSARVNQVALSADGTWLVSAANTLVLFQRVNGAYQKMDEYPSAPSSSDTMETIALSADGKTLVAGDYNKTILLFALQNGKFGTPKTWSVPGGSFCHSVRITPDGTAFAAGGASGNVYLFDVAGFRASGQPTITYHIPNAGSIYGVAIAADGKTFAGIANVSGGTGSVYYIARQGSTGALQWSFATQHNPNSACLNSAKNLLAVADGHPDGTPGTFYFLDTTTGKEIGEYTAGNMSWPIMISADGSGTAAGSDDGNVYYFQVSPTVLPPQGGK